MQGSHRTAAVALRGDPAPRLLRPQDIPGGPWINAPAKRGGLTGSWVTHGLVCDTAGRRHRGDRLAGWFVWLGDAEGHGARCLRARMADVLTDAFGGPVAPGHLTEVLGLPAGARGDAPLSFLEDDEVACLARHVARLWVLAERCGMQVVPTGGATIGRPSEGPLIPTLLAGGAPKVWLLRLRGQRDVPIRSWVEGDTVTSVLDDETETAGGQR